MSRSRKHRNPAADPEHAEGRDSPSKTALKKQAHALQQLGLELSRLPSEFRRRAPMDDDLRDAIDQYLKMRAHEARRRQMQLIGKLLRAVDPAPLQAVVDAFAAGRALDAERLHEAERWRDELIADDDALTRWIAEFPATDVQHFRTLVRNARREGAGTDISQRQPRSYRELFRVVRQTLEQNKSG